MTTTFINQPNCTLSSENINSSDRTIQLDTPQHGENARLEKVIETGIAPTDDFYVTDIYPTEVQVNSEWLRVKNPRMDGVIVLKQTQVGLIAECKLLRDLQIGDLVVTGKNGIRTQPKPAQTKDQEFSFMSAGVSSERRVELAVKQTAWAMSQIRDWGGKIVVVAGPVVIHTGGGEHLARLIREGYAQALLAGNALAVHDIEQNLMGTSLGVDMQKGVGVKDGHRHHLQVINAIRRCGGISRAVDQEVLTSGVMYECVIKGIPYSLAGSIRDDGPYPIPRLM